MKQLKDEKIAKPATADKKKCMINTWDTAHQGGRVRGNDNELATQIEEKTGNTASETKAASNN